MSSYPVPAQPTAITAQRIVIRGDGAGGVWDQVDISAETKRSQSWNDKWELDRAANACSRMAMN
jgi:hypothetical protein